MDTLEVPGPGWLQRLGTGNGGGIPGPGRQTHTHTHTGADASGVFQWEFPELAYLFPITCI